MAPKANVVAAIPDGYRIYIYIYILCTHFCSRTNWFALLFILLYGFAASKCGHSTKSHRLGGV